MKLQRLLAALTLAMFALSCSHVARIENEALAEAGRGNGYGSNIRPTQLGGKLRVVLAFSGGGTRAAALSYGVLKELRDTQITHQGKTARLLDAVTLISSVSGGSFTSAYYGLHGDGIFEDYEESFLRRNIQARLELSLLRPLELLRLTLTSYTRSDMAMDIYDKHVFHGATFQDLADAEGPLLNINATDIDIGTVFTFMQPSMDLLCSDLSKLRVSTAVTASSAVPGAFSPIRLANRAGSCGFEEPEWIRHALANPLESRRRYHNARAIETYLDSKARPNIYLVDGGVADNIGARRVLADVIDTGGFWKLVERSKITMPESILYIVVNAQAGGKHSWVEKRSGPSLKAVLSAVSSVGIYRYNFETIELLRDSTQQWAKEAADRGHPLNAQVAEVAFDNVKDAQDREFFNDVATSFSLDDETVDRLIAVGGQLLRESPEFQKFLAEMNN
jgi:NTE family protein